MRIDQLLIQKEYDVLVQKNSKALLYHSSAYINVVAGHLEAEKLIFGVYQEEKLVGAIPFVMKSTSLGTVLNSMAYYGSNGGLIIDEEVADLEEEIYSSFFDFFKSWCIEKNVISYTIISNPLHTTSSENLAKQMGDFTDQRVGQITPLPEATEGLEAELLKLIENPRPRNIRKAVKSGITVRSSNELEDVKFLFETHVDNIVSIGGIPKKWDFFERVVNDIPSEYWKVYIAEKESEPISALLLFYYNGTVEYFTPSTVHEYRNLQPSSLLIFEGMKEAVTDGFKNWNWGGTWFTQEGVYNFKKKWGAIDFKYEYYTKIVNEEVYSMSKEELLAHFYGIYVVAFDKLIVEA